MYPHCKQAASGRTGAPCWSGCARCKERKHGAWSQGMKIECSCRDSAKHRHHDMMASRLVAAPHLIRTYGSASKGADTRPQGYEVGASPHVAAANQVRLVRCATQRFKLKSLPPHCGGCWSAMRPAAPKPPSRPASPLRCQRSAQAAEKPASGGQAQSKAIATWARAARGQQSPCSWPL